MSTIENGVLSVSSNETVNELLINVYLNKLKRIITNESSFSFGDLRIVNKSRIDDTLCCIQSSYPVEYTEFIKRNGTKSLQTSMFYQQLHAIVTNKFILSSNHYLVNYTQFIRALNSLMQTMTREKQKVLNDNNFKL